MNIKELEDTLIHEITNRVEEINKLTETISVALSSLSQQSVELNLYFKLAKQIPLTDLAKHCEMKATELNELMRVCRLTDNSPQINRALLSRFNIIP